MNSSRRIFVSATGGEEAAVVSAGKGGQTVDLTQMEIQRSNPRLVITVCAAMISAFGSDFVMDSMSVGRVIAGAILSGVAVLLIIISIRMSRGSYWYISLAAAGFVGFVLYLNFASAIAFYLRY